MDFDLTHEDSTLICEPQLAYKANNELNRAWEIVEKTDSNLFLTGRAGTGKTTFLKKLRELSAKRMVVLAPTGVAAINASGTTIHSFFQLPFSVYIPGKGFAGTDKRFLNVSREKKRLIMSLSLLIIDEISMVKPDTLDAVDSILRRLRNSSAPFGGLQLLLIGDLRQLPPVVKDDEWNLVKDYYASPYFFESHALKKAGFHTIELTTVYRQSDTAFLDILNSIRDGRASGATLEAVNRRFIPGFNPSDSEGYIRLTTHNRLADKLNYSRLDAIPAPEFTFEAEVEGKFPESAFPADKFLRLKEGAQVMFVKNDIGSARRYYNGLIGKIVAISDEKIRVVPIGREEAIDVKRDEWEISQYRLDEISGKVIQETTGTFRQYPLQLAWAVTIHKSQGLTFDKAIIDAARSFAPGQTYVALSRCRSLDGLVLGSPLPASAVITDSGINDFIEHYTRNAPDEAAIEKMKLNYASSLLGELFDFIPLRNSFNDFYRSAMEYLAPLYPDIEGELRETKDRIECELVAVATKFLGSCSGAAGNIANPNAPLAGRISKGCGYFLGILEGIRCFLNNLPRNISNRAYAQRLENAFISLNDILGMKAILLRHLEKEIFTVENYLEAKALALIQHERNSASSTPHRYTGKSLRKASDSQKPKKEKKPKGYSTFETLNLYRKGLDIPEIAEKRNLAESTVCRHISDLIGMDKLALNDLADSVTIGAVKQAISANPDFKFTQLLAILQESHPSIPGYIVSIIWSQNRKR